MWKLIFNIFAWKHSISGNVFIVFNGKVNFCELYELKQFSQFNIV